MLWSMNDTTTNLIHAADLVLRGLHAAGHESFGRPSRSSQLVGSLVTDLVYVTIDVRIGERLGTMTAEVLASGPGLPAPFQAVIPTDDVPAFLNGVVAVVQAGAR